MLLVSGQGHLHLDMVGQHDDRLASPPTVASRHHDNIQGDETCFTPTNTRKKRIKQTDSKRRERKSRDASIDGKSTRHRPQETMPRAQVLGNEETAEPRRLGIDSEMTSADT